MTATKTQTEKPRTLEQDVQVTLREIAAFVLDEPFQLLVTEMYARSPAARAGFVDMVVLNRRERLKRGVVVPVDLKIQRSTFGDERPTLFCVSKPLRDHVGKKATFTFDNTLA